jgi:hypothetical protein
VYFENNIYINDYIIIYIIFYIIILMKFLIFRYLTIAITFLSLISMTLGQYHHGHGYQSQSTRNYRKLQTDPSFNPLPHSYNTGPLNNYAYNAPDKYRDYNDGLFTEHHYADTTNQYMHSNTSARRLRKRRR